MQRFPSITVPTAALLVAASLTGCGPSAPPPTAAAPPAAPADPQQQVLDDLKRVAPLARLMLPGGLKPVETAFEDWQYPDANGLETTKGIEEKVSGRGIARHTQLGFRTAMTTEADFPTVVRHYGAKMEALAPMGAENWLPEGRGSQFSQGVSLVYDVNGRTDPNRPRSALQQATFVLQAANCSVHVTINRAGEEESTYIHVVFHKWTVAGG